MIRKLDLFVNKVDCRTFRSTNGFWNQMKFNSPYLWGYVSKIATKDYDSFASKEEWVERYFKTGEERLEFISKLPKSEQKLLLEFSVDIPTNLPDRLKYLNLNYGRTESELISHVEKMYSEVSKSFKNISFDEWKEMVMYRLLGETWNGIAREKNTVLVLYDSLPVGKKLFFKKASATDDYKYAVDFEVYNGEKLVAAIQVKPPSYTGNAPYLQRARKANAIKNTQYRNKKGVGVLYVYSENNGEIVNEEIVKQLLSLAEPTTKALN